MELAKGFEPPTQLITNQLLYQAKLRQPDKKLSLAQAMPRNKKGFRPLASGLWPARASLPKGLKQHNSRRYRDIQAVHVAEHGDRRQQVAPLPHEAAKPGTLGADDQGRGNGKIYLIVARRRVAREAQGPETASFNSSSARAIFTMSAIFTWASAPADALLAAPRERRRMTGLPIPPCAPAASTVRRIAPKL